MIPPISPDMTDAQFRVALVSVLWRIASALEAQASAEEDQTITMPLSAFPTYDWASIGARVLNNDSDGVAQVWHDGKVYTRRSNDKFGEDIWFSRGNGKADDGTPRYHKLIEFRPVKQAEPLGRKTETALRTAASGTPPPPAPVSTPAPSAPAPPSTDTRLKVTPFNAPTGGSTTTTPSLYDVWSGLVKEAQNLGAVVPLHYILAQDDRPADQQRKLQGLREMIAGRKSNKLPETPADKETWRALHAQHADLAAYCDRWRLDIPRDHLIGDQESVESLTGKVAKMQALVDAHKATLPYQQQPTAAATASAATRPSPNTPRTPAQVREAVRAATMNAPNRKNLTERAMVVEALNNVTDGRADVVLAYLCGCAADQVGGACTSAMYGWLKPAKRDGHYLPTVVNAAAEAAAIVKEQQTQAA